jgi:hypothetical protein
MVVVQRAGPHCVSADKSVWLTCEFTDKIGGNERFV